MSWVDGKSYFDNVRMCYFREDVVLALSPFFLLLYVVGFLVFFDLHLEIGIRGNYLFELVADGEDDFGVGDGVCAEFVEFAVASLV